VSSFVVVGWGRGSVERGWKVRLIEVMECVFVTYLQILCPCLRLEVLMDRGLQSSLHVHACHLSQ
jgi:hypothetical protein